MEWYYENNGAQAGPISEAELKGLLAVNQITPATLVWKEGMGDWAPYSGVFAEVTPAQSSGLALGKVPCPTCGIEVLPGELIPAGHESKVCPHCREQYAQSLKEGISPTAGFKQKRGTGGQTPNSELRSFARDALSGYWGSGIAVTLINGILVNGAAQVLPLIGILIQWVLSGPMTYGFNAFFLRLVRGEPAEVGDLFSGFSKFWKYFGLFFLVMIIVYLGGMVAAIPGGILLGVAGAFSSDAVPAESPLFFAGIALLIIPVMIVLTYLGLKYALVYFIAKDEPEMGVFKILERSGQMMKGRKLKLLGLYISFIGWHILGFLAFLIGMLWSFTYMMAAVAAFYDDIGDEEA